MNINKSTWSNLVGAKAEQMDDPETNIEASAVLLKRLSEHVDDPKDGARVGTLWNSTGKEKTSDFGEYIGRLCREKPWRKPILSLE